MYSKRNQKKNYLVWGFTLTDASVIYKLLGLSGSSWWQLELERMRREKAEKGAAGESSITLQEETDFLFHLSPHHYHLLPLIPHLSPPTHSISPWALRSWWGSKINPTGLLYLQCCLCWLFAVNMKFEFSFIQQIWLI